MERIADESDADDSKPLIGARDAVRTPGVGASSDESEYHVVKNANL